ncbi:MAG: tautomerase family protein [Phormidesmis sp. RL_2_1]|nr:tautomerase family protein [Phormidesmis sp. RL_2_1]
MVQVKITGCREQLNPIKAQLSDLVHQCLQEAIGTPENKRFHRFFPLASDDFYYPADRSAQYTIIEIIMFEGRSIPVKKKLLRLLFEQINQQLGIAVEDLEIVMIELPKHNWGIKGIPGDELVLNYVVET